MKYITLLAIPALATSLGAAVTIDDFNEGLFNFSQTGETGGNDGANVTTSSQTGLTTTATIGGAREVRAHNVSGTGDNNVNNQDNPGQFTWNMDSSTTGHFHLNYGSNGGFTELDADFSAENAVAIAVIASDISGFLNITFNMNSGASVWTAQATVPAGVGQAAPNPPSPQNLIISFIDFTHVSGGAFDVSDIDGITVEVAQDYTSADWRFDSIDVIDVPTPAPEPSSAALLGLGAAGMLLRRRRA